jgi:hypothetical protein
MEFKVGAVLKRKDSEGFYNDTSDFIVVIKLLREGYFAYKVKYEGENLGYFSEKFMKRVFEEISKEEYMMYKLSR